MDYPRSKTLGNLLDEVGAKWPDQEAVVFKDQRTTYQQLVEKSNRVAKGLLKLGLKKGEKVAAIVNNRTEWLILAFAVAKCGGVFVPLSTFYRKTEVEYALKHCEVKILFTINRLLNFDYFEMVKEILPALDQAGPGEKKFDGFLDLKYVVSFGDQAKGTYSWNEVLGFAETVSDTALENAQGSVDLKDLAFILLTSGTTAHPKAVQLLHFGVIENPFMIGERQHLGPSDRLWVGIPMCYAFFNTNAMGAIMTHGGTMVIQEYFDPAEALRLIEREKCTVLYGFYNMISALLDHSDFGKKNLSSLRTGATVGTPEEIKLMAKLVPQICNVYGLTESYGNIFVTDSNYPLEVRCRTTGKILPGFEMKIVDEAGSPVPAGEVGEACFKGYVTIGYYKDPENDALAFDDEGWFHTGDLVRVDEDGYFAFVTRKKDMIKTGGINVSPATVENFLMSHPKVKEVHVIGYPDKKKDEVIMAVIELRQGEEASKEEIVQYCKGEIAGYSIPTQVYFIAGEEWPRTATGKIPRNKLRQLMLSKFGGEPQDYNRG